MTKGGAVELTNWARQITQDRELENRTLDETLSERYKPYRRFTNINLAEYGTYTGDL